MKHTYLIATFVSALMLSGGAYAAGGSLTSDGSLAPSETEISIHQKIIADQTTTTDVRGMLGQPDRQSVREDGREQWIYGHAEKHWDFVSYIPVINVFHASATGTEDLVFIVFNSQKVVERVDWKSHQFVFNDGLFG